MKKAMLAFFVIYSHYALSATWKKISTTLPSSSGTAGSVLTQSQCPEGYILIEPMAPYTEAPFCIMKYEAKNDGYGIPVSTPGSAPWFSISRDSARIKCRGLGAGYDLPSNEQWQTIARDIIGLDSNWSAGTVTNTAVNSGHTDGSPALPQAASADDNQPCINTGQSCTAGTWNSQKRTHNLSSGKVIWDFGGNVEEWITYDSEVSHGTNSVSVLVNSGEKQVNFGALTSTHCSAWYATPYCGFGSFIGNSTYGAWTRGSGNNSSTSSFGVLSLNGISATTSNNNVGFRCVYSP